MPVIIPDQTLEAAGLSEREAYIEIACRLFDIDRLTLAEACRLAGLERIEFEEQLRLRNLAAYRPTVEDLEDDLATLERLRETRSSGRHGDRQ